MRIKITKIALLLVVCLTLFACATVPRGKMVYSNPKNLKCESVKGYWQIFATKDDFSEYCNSQECPARLMPLEINCSGDQVIGRQWIRYKIEVANTKLWVESTGEFVDEGIRFRFADEDQNTKKEYLINEIGDQSFGGEMTFSRCCKDVNKIIYQGKFEAKKPDYDR